MLLLDNSCCSVVVRVVVCYTRGPEFDPGSSQKKHFYLVKVANQSNLSMGPIGLTWHERFTWRKNVGTFQAIYPGYKRRKMMSIPFEFGFNTEDHITRSLFLYCVKCRRQTILQSTNTSDVRDSNVAFFSQKIVLCPKNNFAWSVLNRART